MNQQLVQSIAQIVLAMTAEERQLFDRLVNELPTSDLSTSNENGKLKEEQLNKDAQIAQIAQQMQEFKENHATPLSPLPEDRWGV